MEDFSVFFLNLVISKIMDVYQWRILNALLPVGVVSDGACLTSQWQKTSGESIWPFLKSPYDVFRQPRVQGNNFDKE